MATVSKAVTTDTTPEATTTRATPTAVTRTRTAMAARTTKTLMGRMRSITKDDALSCREQSTHMHKSGQLQQLLARPCACGDTCQAAAAGLLISGALCCDIADAGCSGLFVLQL